MSKLEEVILRGTRAGQPAANTVADGSLYFVIDELVIERSNGSAWESYSGAGSSSVIRGGVVLIGLPGEDGAEGEIGLPGRTGPTGSGISELTGDITAGPGSGSQVATIGNDKVTYAKIQNISAASKLLGRGSAGGSGDTEEITLGSNLSMSGTTISASGGSGAAWSLIESRAVGSGGTEDFLNLNNNELMILFVGLKCNDNAVINMRVSIDNGSTFLSASGDYKVLGITGSESDVTLMLMTTLTTGSVAKTTFRFICNANGTTDPKLSWHPANPIDNAYRIPTTSPIDAVRLLPGTGNFASAGTIYIFGRG